MEHKQRTFSMWYALLAMLAVFAIQAVIWAPHPENISYSEFKALLKSGKVSELGLYKDTIEGTLSPTGLDGILANAPAMYWTRFQTAQMWGQIAMKDLTGSPIDANKTAQATASAVAACDAADGVVDGIIDDPRTCKFSATANICGAPTAPATNCLTPAEAQAVDLIWDGPRNADGKRIWFGLDRGTNIGTGFALNSAAPFALGVTQFHWDEHDRTFDWKTVSMGGYSQVAQDGSRNIADVTALRLAITRIAAASVRVVNR